MSHRNKIIYFDAFNKRGERNFDSSLEAKKYLAQKGRVITPPNDLDSEKGLISFLSDRHINIAVVLSYYPHTTLAKSIAEEAAEIDIPVLYLCKTKRKTHLRMRSHEGVKQGLYNNRYQLRRALGIFFSDLNGKNRSKKDDNYTNVHLHD